MDMLMMLGKSIYAIQPYQVGRKDKKSLAIIIPAKIARECNVNPSTIFAVQVNKQNMTITMQTVRARYENNTMPAEESSKASRRQASEEQ